MSRREARLNALGAQQAAGQSKEETDEEVADLFHGSSPESEHTAKPRRKRRWVWWVAPPLLLLAVCGVFTFVLFTQAMAVKDDLTAMKSELEKVVHQVKNGDEAGATATADRIKTLSARANGTVDSALWDVAAAIPFVGSNVGAVAETTKATDIIVSEALPSVLKLLTTFNPSSLRLEGGGINLQPFRDAVPMLPALSDTFTKAQSHLDKIDRGAILPLVEENIGQVLDMVTQATPLIESGEKYLPVLLPMFGDGGTRTYVVMFQNNAETRATGGNPGNAAVITVNNGKVSMREDAQVLEFSRAGYAGTGFTPIEPSEKANLFEWDTSLFVQNFTRYPDFADTSEYVHRLWTAATGEKLDGVISLDPVVLSYMLSVAGPVNVPQYSQQITGDNAVKVLLSDAYENFPTGADSQKFFDAAARDIFAKVVGGGWDPLSMISAFKRGIEEQRVYLSFANPKEQEMVVDGSTAGRVNADLTESAQVGVYLNDAAFSKLDYYLDTTMAVSCNANDRTVTTTLTLKNGVPSSNLSDYTLGARNKRLGFDRTTMLFDVISFALPGGKLVGVEPAASDLANMQRTGEYNGRDAKSMFIAVPMGQTRTVSFTSSVPDSVKVPLEVRYTPTTKNTPVSIDASCAAMFPGTKIPQR